MCKWSKSDCYMGRKPVIVCSSCWWPSVRLWSYEVQGSTMYACSKKSLGTPSFTIYRDLKFPLTQMSPHGLPYMGWSFLYLIVYIVTLIPAKLLLVGRNNWQYILWMGQRPTIFDQHSMSETIQFNLNSKQQSTSTSLVSSQPGDKGGTTFIWLEKEKKMYACI